MLVLVMSLLCWTQTEGGCSETLVSISGDNGELSAGESFKLSCEFTCLGAHHVAQLWRNSGYKDGVSLVNITSIHPSVSLVLIISFATKSDTGNYSCMTQPPDTISPTVSIQIADNLTTTMSTLTTANISSCYSTQQPSRAAGLQGQVWYWMLLGKSAILLFSLASLAVKYKRG
ncbi:uncharacterized protein LOC122886646 isoform X2 [Lates japonicus]